MTIWYCSDHHFGHTNIISFCNRPFSDAKEMNEKLVSYHNLYVKPEDHVWFLGDVTMERDNRGDGLAIVARMNGHKRLILGNHDHYDAKHYLRYFEKVQAMHMHDNIRFTHIPIHPSSMGMATANVHGHIHNNQSSAFPPVLTIDKITQKVVYKPYVNISLEVTGYRPLSLEEVKDRIAKAKGEYDGTKVGPEVSLSTVHCEVCAPEDVKLKGFRCPAHA